MANGQGRSEVIVKDIDMPFLSMVWFMVKWAVASIPAFIILFVIGAFAASLLVGGLVGAGGLLGGAAAGVAGTADNDRSLAASPNDPAGIAGSFDVYLDGAKMLYHAPGCPDVAKLSSPMTYEPESARGMGYGPHYCARR